MNTIYDLNDEIWLTIINVSSQGNIRLSIKDFLNLTCLDRRLRKTLTNDIIWRELLITRYGNNDIDLVRVLKRNHNIIENSLSKQGEHLYHQLALNIFRKESGISAYIKKNLYSNWMKSFAYLIERYGTDAENMIAIDSYRREQLDHLYVSIMSSSQVDSKDQISIFPSSLIENLQYANNFKLAVEYFRELISNDYCFLDPSDYENFFFNISRFDSGFADILQYRKDMLNNIQATIESKFIRPILRNQMWGGKNVKLECNSNGEETLYVKNDDLLAKVILQILILASKELTVTEGSVWSSKARNSFSLFLEDFSVLRIYANQVRGHPFIIYSILAKVVYEQFLSKMNITIGDERYSRIDISISEFSLCIHNYHFILSDDVNRNSIFLIQEKKIKSYIRTHLGIISEREVHEYLRPMQKDDLIGFFLHLGENKQLRSLIDPSSMKKLVLDASKRNHFLIPFYPSNYKYEDFRLANAVCKCLCLNLKKDQRSEYKLDHMVKEGRNQIHYFTLKELNLLNNDFNFSLRGSVCLPSSLEIAAEKNFSSNKEGIKPICVGSIIEHEKFNTIGIILAEFEEGSLSDTYDKYYMVRTLSGNIETYKKSSIKLLEPTVYTQYIYLVFFLSKFAVDTYTLSHFNSIRRDGDIFEYCKILVN